MYTNMSNVHVHYFVTLSIDCPHSHSSINCVVKLNFFNFFFQNNLWNFMQSIRNPGEEKEENTTHLFPSFVKIQIMKYFSFFFVWIRIWSIACARPFDVMFGSKTVCLWTSLCHFKWNLFSVLFKITGLVKCILFIIIRTSPENQQLKYTQ